MEGGGVTVMEKAFSRPKKGVVPPANGNSNREFSWAKEAGAKIGGYLD